VVEERDPADDDLLHAEVVLEAEELGGRADRGRDVPTVHADDAHNATVVADDRVGIARVRVRGRRGVVIAADARAGAAEDHIVAAVAFDVVVAIARGFVRRVDRERAGALADRLPGRPGDARAVARDAPTRPPSTAVLTVARSARSGRETKSIEPSPWIVS